jgi:hypothetical protein
LETHTVTWILNEVKSKPGGSAFKKKEDDENNLITNIERFVVNGSQEHYVQ